MGSPALAHGENSNATIAEPGAGVQGSLPPSQAGGSKAVGGQQSVAEPDFLKLIAGINPVGWAPQPVNLYESQPQASSGAIVPQPLSQYRVFSDPLVLETLLEYRCNRIVRREYYRGQRRLVIEVYKFNDSRGAYGAYNMLRHGASTVVTRGDGSSEDDQSISFWQDKYFVYVFATSQEDEESKDVVRVMADTLAAAFRAHASLPPVVVRMPRLDRLHGSEKLVMGPLSAKRFFPAPYMSNLMLDRIREAAVSDYKFQAPHPERLKLLMIDYGNAELASTAFNTYIGMLGELHPVLESEDGSQKSSSFKLAQGFLYCGLRGQQLLLINGARKRGSAYYLARQIN